MGRSLIDITNQRFGRWVALCHLGGGLWACRCDCGTRLSVKGGDLYHGRSKSCGCLTQYRNITGERFGRLIALLPVSNRRNKKVFWTFRCDCGSIIERSGADVIRGKTKSCGCLCSSVSAAHAARIAERTAEINRQTVCKYGHPRNELWEQHGQCYKCKICQNRGLPFDTDEAVLDALCLLTSVRRDLRRWATEAERGAMNVDVPK